VITRRLALAWLVLAGLVPARLASMPQNPSVPTQKPSGGVVLGKVVDGLGVTPAMTNVPSAAARPQADHRVGNAGHTQSIDHFAEDHAA
jgi:hypothetical protein